MKRPDTPKPRRGDVARHVNEGVPSDDELAVTRLEYIEAQAAPVVHFVAAATPRWSA